jgi:hypothetical protein
MGTFFPWLLDLWIKDNEPNEPEAWPLILKLLNHFASPKTKPVAKEWT